MSASKNMIITLCVMCGIGLFGALVVFGFGQTLFHKQAKPQRNDTRSAGRFRFSAGPALHWLENGKQVTLRTKAANISEYGAQVVSKKALEVGKTVHMHIPELGLTGRAVVRHCTERGNAFALGIEFIGSPTRSGAKGIKLSRLGTEERVEILG